MKIKKKKWIVYTLGIGIVPFLLRLLVYILMAHNTIDPVSTSDLTFFGLILCVSVINESELVEDSTDNWKTLVNGTSLFLIVFFSALFAFSLIMESYLELFNRNMLIIVAGILCLWALMLSFFMYKRIE